MSQSTHTRRLAILGAGGLGKGMAQMAAARPGFKVVAMADSSGYCYDDKGLNIQDILPLKAMAQGPGGVPSANSIDGLLTAHDQGIDAIFMALPNLPVEFYGETIAHIIDRTRFRGVMVDALKRTRAVELLLPLHDKLAKRGILYITGAGATPGFLTTVAAVAAQSFVEVLEVNIHFGVGVANWEQYKATIREDFLHLQGFTAERVAQMTDEEIERELDARNGLLELVNMEHADDVILEWAGVCPRDRVTVGGLVDTRNSKKPVSTTVTVRGRTLSGAIGVHTFTVADETTMVDNVCGPAMGFLNRGFEVLAQGQTGLVTSASLMPNFGPPVGVSTPLASV